MTSAANEDAIARVKAYIETQGWAYSFDSEASTFEVARVREDIPEKLYFKISRHEQLLFYIVPELAIPAAFHGEVVEYLTRVNCGMRIGNFEFDYKDAKIRFKSSVAFKGDRLSSALIGAAIEPAMIAWKDYLMGVIRVVTGVSPIQVLTEIDYGSSE